MRLTSGALAVFSPVALTPEVKAKIAELGGTIRYIVAPDIEHHIFVSDWKREFPDAYIIGPEGLPEKRAKSKDDKVGSEDFFKVFEAKTKAAMAITPEFDADFAYEYVDAHMNRELVFFYKPDRALIEADLLFNLPPTEQYSRVQGPRQGQAGPRRPPLPEHPDHRRRRQGHQALPVARRQQPRPRRLQRERAPHRRLGL